MVNYLTLGSLEQRKLSTPEYRNVDEEYRVATIKHTTTQIAADDLKKYASALDKVRFRAKYQYMALLCFQHDFFY